MKDLKNDDGVHCESDNDKLRALVDRNFLTKKQDPLVVEADSEMEVGYSVEELEEKVRNTLRGTSNKSAPRPDGISYRFIKMVLDTRLGREVITEVAISLREGWIPEEWQLSKMVFIPKPSKDHRVAKGWSPINLINCIGKLAEKVVAD